MTSSTTCSIAACIRSTAPASSSTKCPATRAPARGARHNLNYWEFGDYLGHRRGRTRQDFVCRSRGIAVRTQQTREPRRYLAADPGALVRKTIASRELPFEFAMNGFRLVEGFADELFEARTGLADRGARAGAGTAGRRAGWSKAGRKRWRATPKGFRFLNEILVELLPDAESPQPLHEHLPRAQSGFMHRCPIDGHVNNGITAGFNPVAR